MPEICIDVDDTAKAGMRLDRYCALRPGSVSRSRLKNGALYRIPLNADGKTAQGDVPKYFHTPNRYRSALVSPDGKTIYVATDVRGNALGNDGKPVNDMKNPGSIIAFIYDAKQ